jgi:hypothetical protein
VKFYNLKVAIPRIVILLNNMTQPLAGLVVGMFSVRQGPGLIILILSVGMGCVGILVLIVPLIRRDRSNSAVSVLSREG